MAKERITLARVAEALEGLRQELTHLSDRVAALEKLAQFAARPVSTPSADRATTAADELSDELVMVIGAAVAAFLGKRAHVRQIRLLGSAAWLHQGRVTVQASHAFSHTPG
jgi:methylmalonyl-CoA carboxyltransferase large subunit